MYHLGKQTKTTHYLGSDVHKIQPYKTADPKVKSFKSVAKRLFNSKTTKSNFLMSELDMKQISIKAKKWF